MPGLFSRGIAGCGTGKPPPGSIFFVGSCLLLLLCIFSGCNDRGESDDQKSKPGLQAPQAGGVYRIPLLNNPKSLDPAQAEDQYSAAVVYQLYDGLVRFSPDLLIIPALAENWQIEQDGLVYRFFLRKNALFHNGQPVTAQDVLFSLSRLIRTDPAPSILPHMLRIAGAREYRSGQSDHVTGIEVLGDKELLIRLEEPHAPFLAALGMHQTRIVPRDEVLKRKDHFSLDPVGSGAFRFLSGEDNKSVRLKRFPEYYLGPAHLEEIQYAVYPGGRIEDVLTDFLAHKLDEMPVYGKIRDDLLSRKDIKWMHRPSLSLLFYGMNCEHPLLRHPAVRRALSMAIDREKLASTVYGGQFEAAGRILPPGMLGYRPESPGIEYDLAKAQKELASVPPAELGDNPTLEVVSAIQSPVARAELEFTAQSWEKLGIDVKIRFIPDWAEFEQYVKSPSMQIYRYAWFMDIPDPDNIMQVLFGSDSNVNYMRYRNTEVDKMLRTARILLQPVERAAFYGQIEDLIAQTAPVIPLVHLGIDQVYQSNVEGIQLNALGGHKVSFHQVWLSHGEIR